jgi:hypothetical protein
VGKENTQSAQRTTHRRGEGGVRGVQVAKRQRARRQCVHRKLRQHWPNPENRKLRPNPACDPRAPAGKLSARRQDAMLSQDCGKGIRKRREGIPTESWTLFKRQPGPNHGATSCHRAGPSPCARRASAPWRSAPHPAKASALALQLQLPRAAPADKIPSSKEET